jgi:hypothetical protein|nr:MAG TPA: hypothetical protein [Caudoviricetes sp.]
MAYGPKTLAYDFLFNKRKPWVDLAGNAEVEDIVWSYRKL